jgi:hypothetical protein
VKTQKATWQNKNWSKSQYPERAMDYLLYKELVLHGMVIATIECFASNPRCFYANTANQRSGCLEEEDWARQWCEIKTGNNMN